MTIDLPSLKESTSSSSQRWGTGRLSGISLTSVGKQEVG